MRGQVAHKVEDLRWMEAVASVMLCKLENATKERLLRYHSCPGYVLGMEMFVVVVAVVEKWT